ncbi:MAG: hypothetical protein SGJ21_03085 [Alphaproteobacteria bacterium]|nr:hypothetical protein [Alphaproteobacteria bacterium]
MTAKSSPGTMLALLLGVALIGAAPAYAKTSIQKGESVCKAAISAQQPAVRSVRVDKDATRVNSTQITYSLKVRQADNTVGTLVCSVDRETQIATVSPKV